MEILDETIRQVKDAEQRLAAAMRHADTVQLDLLLHDNLVFVGYDGRILGKAEDLETHRSGLLRITAINLLEQSIQPVGNTVSVVALVALSGHYDKIPFEGKYQYLRIWKAFGTNWKIIAGSCSMR